MGRPKPQVPAVLAEQLQALREENARLRSEVKRSHMVMLELEETRDSLRVEHNRLARMTHHLQRAVELAEAADVAKTEFLARMSHELRTPLHAVIATAELLLTTDLSVDQCEHAQTIGSAGRALLGLINNILDISKIEAGTFALEPAAFAPASLMTEVDRCMRPLAHEAQVTLEFVPVQDDGMALVGDANRLRQVLTNLVSNAIKFAPGGDVRVELSVTPAPAAADGARRCLQLVVEDDGIGIADADRRQLFDRFAPGIHAPTSAPAEGAGLGLAIAKQLIDMMDGEITVASQPGSGARFEVRVELAVAPLQAETPPQAVAPADGAQAQASTGSERTAVAQGPDDDANTRADTSGLALVVDDNRVNRKVASRMLQNLGFDVIVACDGAEAIERYREQSESPFALILMDCQMPNLDGFEATRQIRALEAAVPDRHIPIIALTANALSGNEADCLDAGMDGYQTKPMSLDALRMWISRLPELGRR